jgi:type II secretory pathway component GspD/PulD (secretin)
VKSQADIIDAVMVALIGVQKTPAVPSGPNIKIEIGFDETGTQSGSGIGVRGNVGGRDIRFGNRRSPGVDVNINSGTQTRSRVQSQFLVVQSGGAASLNVVREVPVVDYFYGYAGRHGLWEERQLRWERVGTQLVVEPVWKNGLIEVTVLPRITAWSQGREYGLDVRELATRVTVAEGRRVHLGWIQRCRRFISP